MAAATPNTTKTKITLKGGRFSYLNVYTPRAIQNADGSAGEPRYSLAYIMNKRKLADQIEKCEDAIEAAKLLGVTKCAKWGGKVPKRLVIEMLKDGDDRDDMDKNPEYDGCIILNCGSKQRPGVVDENIEELLDASRLYSGCYGNIEVNFFPYDKGKNGISCGLNFVQLTKEGEALAGRGSAADAFGDEDDDQPKKKKRRVVKDDDDDDDIDDLM